MRQTNKFYIVIIQPMFSLVKVDTVDIFIFVNKFCNIIIVVRGEMCIRDRDKSHSREIGGTGLGLSIARSAVVMHRGAIKVFSQMGEGTTFTVRIPLSYIA